MTSLDSVLGSLAEWEVALNLVTVVVLPIELVWLHRSGRLDRQRGREMVASGVQFLPLLLTSVVSTAAWFAVFRWVEALVPWEIELTPWTIVLVLLGADFLYYWEHRSGHRVNALWSLYHSVHHSSPVYDQSTAYRLSAFDGTIGAVFTVPLVLAGFPAALVLAAAGVVVGYQTWIHTETVRRLPRVVEWLFNTPSHHRAHHGTNPEYLDKNYGGILIVWDRLFATFEPEQSPVTYGLTTQIGNTRWIDAQIFELRNMIRALVRASSWAQRVGILVRPPGWGTHQRQSGLQADRHLTADATPTRQTSSSQSGT
jgi:sterol desaturase/sphingolipid hydroxylase (fatty acid hydroxylase superfamily)